MKCVRMNEGFDLSCLHGKKNAFAILRLLILCSESINTSLVSHSLYVECYPESDESDFQGIRL